MLNNTDLNAAIDALGRSANMNLIAAGGTKARKKVTLNLRGAPLRDVMLALANLYGLIWFKSGEVYTLTYVSVSTKRLGVSAPWRRVHAGPWLSFPRRGQRPGADRPVAPPHFIVGSRRSSGPGPHGWPGPELRLDPYEQARRIEPWTPSRCEGSSSSVSMPVLPSLVI